MGVLHKIHHYFSLKHRRLWLTHRHKHQKAHIIYLKQAVIGNFPLVEPIVEIEQVMRNEIEVFLIQPSEILRINISIGPSRYLRNQRKLNIQVSKK